MPSIDRSSATPFYQQIYEQVARGIENGLYAVGEKLPSIRECARELGVSNTTIEFAYQRLVEEGYVQARQGSGFTICPLSHPPASAFDRFTSEYHRDQEALAEAERERASRARPAYDFAYDSVDASVFPFDAWSRVCREVFFSEGAKEACLYNDRQGLRCFREQIAMHLGREHGLDCMPEQVLVMPRTRDLVSEIVSLFDVSEAAVAIGDPGYDEVRRRLSKRGYRLQAIPTHPHPTWEQARAAIDGARIVFATPASQFPTNRVMPLEMRKSLVAWAQEHDAYLIDDEYGWEFQSGIARTPSLAALDNVGRTITIGAFSNSFTPAVCLSYAVLPPRLMIRWQVEGRSTHPQVPWQTQAAMAAFMREGHWRAHVRRARTSMRRKRQALSDAIAVHLGDSVEVVDGSSSLFMLVQTRDGRGEAELIEAGERAGVRVYPTSRYWSGEAPRDWRYVLVGFAGIPEEDIEPGIRALARAWGCA